MKLGQWRRKLSAGAALATTAAIFSGYAASATMGGSGSVAVPANYRQLVAAKLRQMEDASSIRSPQISRPYERFVGLLFGGTRPVVCVRLIRPNMIGMQGTYFYLFYFTNGQADGFQQTASNFAEQALIGCGNQPLTSFTELGRSR